MQPRIALIIETSSEYGRQILRGVADFLRTHEPWSVFLDQRDLFAATPEWLNDWKGDGLILRTRRVSPASVASRLPTIDLCDMLPPSEATPRIESDHERIGELAARHLIDAGHRSFGFCGFREHWWSAQRLKGFRRVAETQASHFAVYESRWTGKGSKSWEQEQKRLARWIKEQPKPIGIMAANDLRAQHLLDAASRVGVLVPEQAAVVGCDNEDVLCDLCSPPLSSVQPDARAVGFAAAEALSKMLTTGHAGSKHHLVPPRDLVIRGSSDNLAVEDQLVARAMSAIREGARDGLTASQLAKQLGVSRTTLERRFRAALKSTPHQHIREARLRHAKSLLRSTSLSIERIAYLVGFEHAEYLSVVFKRLYGQTPGSYRASQR